MEYVYNKATTNIGRVLNVTGAGYADCNGLYTLSNNTRYYLILYQSYRIVMFSNPPFASIWDSKRVVYERIAGGWGREKRWKIYIIYIIDAISMFSRDMKWLLRILLSDVDVSFVFKFLLP